MPVQAIAELSIGAVLLTVSGVTWRWNIIPGTAKRGALFLLLLIGTSMLGFGCLTLCGQ